MPSPGSSILIGGNVLVKAKSLQAVGAIADIELAIGNKGLAVSSSKLKSLCKGSCK